MTFWASFGRSQNLVLKLKLKWLATPRSMNRYQLAGSSPHGTIAPSKIDRVGSGKTRSGSISSLWPNPPHVAQAPNGELKEKRRGEGSSKESPQLGHAAFSEKTDSSFEPVTTRAVPPASRNAVSSESASRDLIVGAEISRSTTASIVCFVFLLREGTSSSS